MALAVGQLEGKKLDIPKDSDDQLTETPSDSKIVDIGDLKKLDEVVLRVLKIVSDEKLTGTKTVLEKFDLDDLNRLGFEIINKLNNLLVVSSNINLDNGKDNTLKLKGYYLMNGDNVLGELPSLKRKNELDKSLNDIYLKLNNILKEISTLISNFGEIKSKTTQGHDLDSKLYINYINELSLLIVTLKDTLDSINLSLYVNSFTKEQELPSPDYIESLVKKIEDLHKDSLNSNLLKDLFSSLGSIFSKGKIAFLGKEAREKEMNDLVLALDMALLPEIVNPIIKQAKDINTFVGSYLSELQVISRLLQYNNGGYEELGENSHPSDYFLKDRISTDLALLFKIGYLEIKEMIELILKNKLVL